MQQWKIYVFLKNMLDKKKFTENVLYIDINVKQSKKWQIVSVPTDQTVLNNPQVKCGATIKS